MNLVACYFEATGGLSAVFNLEDPYTAILSSTYLHDMENSGMKLVLKRCKDFSEIEPTHQASNLVFPIKKG